MTEEPFDAKPYDAQVTAEDIYNCYRLLLGRIPDEFGWKTKTAIKDRLTVEELVLSFLTSARVQKRWALSENARAR